MIVIARSMFSMINKEQIGLLKSMFQRDYVLLSFVIGIILFAIGMLYKINIIAYISCLLIFTSFDCIGWQYLITDCLEHNFKANEKGVINYRILQATVQFMLICCCYLLTPSLAIAFTVAWWFGFCDLLYYLLLTQNFVPFGDDMYWLWWTPYGIVLLLFKKKITWQYLIAFGILGFILGLGIAI